MFNCCNSLYGNYRTRKFTEIYNTVDKFLNDYNTVGIPKTITEDTARTLYYLLYARYGNSSIANNDENQFKYKLFSIVFMYAPTWEKRLEIQQTLRGLTEDEILKGSKQITNHSYNPSTEPSTDTLEELTTINEQNTNQFKKSKLDGYNILWNLLSTDVTESFISTFKKCFLVVVEPQEPLWYETPEQEG